MTLDPQLSALMRQTISVKTLTTRDGDGTPTFSSAASVAARVVKRYALVQIETGEQIKTTHEIRVENEIEDTDKIWMPGDSNSDESLAKQPYDIRASAAEDGTNDFWIFKV